MVDDYHYDLFVSYASPDNELPAPWQGWVTKLVDGLHRTLRAKLTREPRIYFDQNTAEPNQPWSRIDNSCRRSRLFLAINSPVYGSRDWPVRELELFASEASDPEQIFVVETTPMNDPGHDALRARTSKRFYVGGEAGSRRPMPIMPGTEAFAARIWDLTEAMVAQLQRMESDQAAPRPSPRAVLLAQTTEDLDDERDAVWRYLQQFDIEMIRRTEYPRTGPEFRRAFASDLAQATLMVQLLGPHAGRHPPDLAEGYVRHQHEAARASGVPVMQWRSSALDAEAVADSAYRDILRGDTVTASTLEQFKRDLRARLEAPPAAPALTGTGARAGRIVFVNAELSDADVARRMMDDLGDDYTVVIPLYDAQGSNQKDYTEKLEACDVLLVVYGQSGPEWIDRTLLHVLKVRRSRLPFGAVCMGPPPDKPIVTVRSPLIRQLDCTGPAGDDWRLEPVKQLMAQLPC